MDKLENQNVIHIKQRRELIELAGFETRNKYEVIGTNNIILGYVAEQGKGAIQFLMRSFLGHWRTFELFIFDENKQKVATVKNPFRIYFSELQVLSSNDKLIGKVKKEFALLYKKFSIKLQNGECFETLSPFWKIWTFPITRNGKEVAIIRKKWSGSFKEVLTDSDNFEIEFLDSNLSLEARLMFLAAGVYVDLQYFERKAGE